jgi:TonB family protein
MRRKVTWILTLTLAVMPSSLWARQSVTRVTPQILRPSDSTKNAQKGFIEQGTYKNPSIGLEFTPARGLRFNEPELKGTPGTTPLLIFIQAQTDPGPFYGLTVFYADALDYYSEDQRNDSRYLQKIIRTNASDGFQQVDGKASAEMNGIHFVRADFVKGIVHETVLIRTHKAYELVFIFSGADGEVTNNLILSTHVKFAENEVSIPLHQSTSLDSGASPFVPGKDGVGYPSCIYCPLPSLPEAARKAEVHGTVLLQAVIGTNGQASSISVKKTPGNELDAKAIAAVKTWRFKPAQGPKGKPVAVTTDLEVNFTR